MKNTRRVISISFIIVFFLSLSLIYAHVADSENVTAEKSGRFEVLGPFTHLNLALYLVKGCDIIHKTRFVTLEQALEDKKVTIEETGQVNNLVISSRYTEEYVFIQAGDIVRGGRQDRTLGTDFIVPPGAKKMPLQSFCVESGRWQARGGEDAGKFSVSGNQVASRQLRVANRLKKSQQEVWYGVSELQDKLSDNTGSSVKSPVSPSSLELTLDNKDVKTGSQEYVEALQGIIKGREHIVGFVFAINGQLNTAEVYGSEELFRQLWPKLLRTTAVEAFAELEKDKQYQVPSAKIAAAFLEYPEKTQTQRNRINDWLSIITHQGKDKVIFESLFTKEYVLIHVTTIQIDEEDMPTPVSSRNRRFLQQGRSLDRQQEQQ
jgi:hypothetical protein